MKNIPKKSQAAKLVSSGIQHDKIKSGSLPSFGANNNARFNEEIGFYIPNRNNYRKKKPYPDSNIFPLQ